MKKTFLIFILLLLTIYSKAATYYFSSSGGNDSYTSTQAQNQATPWKTIAKLNSYMASIHPGDIISFKAGDIFQIPEGINTGGLLITVNGTSTNPITITSYGSGALPIFTLPPITGFTGGPVYTASWTIQTCCSILYEDGIPLTKASSSACTDGNWYGSSGTLYYKPTSATPASHTVTVANINNSYIPGIDLSHRQFVTVQNIAFNSIGIGIKTFDSAGAGTKNLTIQNCTFSYCQSGIFMMPDTGNNNNALIKNNYFYRCQVGVRMYTTAAIGGSSTVGTHIGCQILNNEMSQCGTTDGTVHWQSSVAGTDYEAIGVQNFMSGTISNNNIHDGYVIGLSWYNLSTRHSDNNTIQNNIIQNNLKGGIILIGNGTYNYAYNGNLFSNNLFVNSNGGPGNGGGTIAVYPGTLTTVNSLFVNNTLSGSLNNFAFENGNAPYFTIENNIIYGSGSNQFVAYSYSSKPATLTMDYNLYYQPSVVTSFWQLSASKTLAQMQALGMELHSHIADPKFVNISATNFQLQSTSPAIDAGINVGLPYFGAAPDIGAYEYSGDYTAILQAAINANTNYTVPGSGLTYSVTGLSVPANHNVNLNGNTIKLTSTPANTFRLMGNNTIQNGTIEGVWNYATDSYSTSGTSGVIINGSNVILSGLTIQAFPTYGIGCFGACSNITINNCFVQQCGYMMLYIDPEANTSNVSVTNNLFDNIMIDPTKIVQVGIGIRGSTFYTTGYKISNITFTGNTVKMPLYPSGSSLQQECFEIRNCTNAIVTGNKFYQGTIGISVANVSNSTVSNNNTYNSKAEGFEFFGCHGIVTAVDSVFGSHDVGVLLDGYGTSGVTPTSNLNLNGFYIRNTINSGIHEYFGTHNITVSSSDIGLSTATFGIYLQQSDTLHVFNTKIDGGFVPNTIGIYFENSPGNADIHNGSIKNVSCVIKAYSITTNYTVDNIYGYNVSLNTGASLFCSYFTNGAHYGTNIGFVYTTLSFGALSPVNYGVPDFSPGATSALPITYSTSNSSIATIVLGNIHILQAGSVNISASNGDTTATQPLTINKVGLTIKADTLSKSQGSANPVLTYKFIGFQYSDNSTSLSSQPSLSTTATTSSSPGSYPITVSGGTALSYNISRVNSVLNVISSATHGPVIRNRKYKISY